MSAFHFALHPVARPDERGILIPHLENKAELFAFFAREIPLPDYFGHNWDALEECLGEMGREDAQKIGFVHLEMPLAASPRDQRIYLQVLASIAGQSEQLSIVFPEKCRQQILRLLP